MAKEKRFKVGDKVLWVYKSSRYDWDSKQNIPTVETKEVTVIAVGSKWVTTEGGRWRPWKFNMETGESDQHTYGTIYKNEEERILVEEAVAKRRKQQKDWDAFRRYASRLYYNGSHVPPLASEDLHRIGAELGMKEEDWNNG